MRQEIGNYSLDYPPAFLPYELPAFLTSCLPFP
jgi:hypothetical protein